MLPQDRILELQTLLDRANDGCVEARWELLGRAAPELHRLASKILRDYPVVRQHQNTSDISSEASLRLFQALNEVQIPKVLDFFRLAACRMRWILLDMAKKPEARLQHHHNVDVEEQSDCHWPGQISNDSIQTPARWVELHQAVENLPEKEKDVIDLLFYHNLTEVEAAAVLGVSAKTVHRRHLSARLRLFERLAHDGAK